MTPINVSVSVGITAPHFAVKCILIPLLITSILGNRLPRTFRCNHMHIRNSSVSEGLHRDAVDQRQGYLGKPQVQNKDPKLYR
jgi:hypothetical protein